MRLDDVLERIWPAQEVEAEPLGGGLTNHNFKVVVGAEAYVLRVGGKDTELLGIDRSAECEASRVAAMLGIGPEVAEFVEPEGYLVTRFVEGRPIPLEEMRRPETVARAAEVLRTLHAGPAIPGRFDSFRVVETYRDTALAHGIPEPSRYGWAAALANEIEHARGTSKAVPCHNDLLNANFLDDGAVIRIVDWEYAGMGDPFFDLANFSVNHELAEDDDRTLLRAYFGEEQPENLAALSLMRFMSDFREAMWGVVQRGISRLDFDFLAYEGQHFARLEETASSDRFRRALTLQQTVARSAT